MKYKNKKDEDDSVFYIPFNIIYIISRQWKDDNEKLCAMKGPTVMSCIPTSVGFKLQTLWSEIGSANHSATWTLRNKKEKQGITCFKSF